MQIDSYFTNGSVKKTCQDYVIHGESPIPYVILCDGCSSSRFTDVGSRILAHSAKNTLISLLSRNEPWVDRVFYEVFGASTISNAYTSIKELNIPTECLDSTLIVLFNHPVHNQPVCVMYGDGYIVTTKQSMVTNIWWSTFEGNAPYYLSYLVDNERRKIYENYAEDRYVRKDHYIINHKDRTSNEGFIANAHNSPRIFYIDIDYCDSIFIASDGIDSFVDTENAIRIPFKYILKEFMAFKNINGKYIERRVRRSMEDFTKVNIHNTDDVSFGGMILG
jgi:hypothetical protein